jgi:hypothetical protein
LAERLGGATAGHRAQRDVKRAAPPLIVKQPDSFWKISSIQGYALTQRL